MGRRGAERFSDWNLILVLEGEGMGSFCENGSVIHEPKGCSKKTVVVYVAQLHRLRIVVNTASGTLVGMMGRTAAELCLITTVFQLHHNDL
jgi:hypothetical protein